SPARNRRFRCVRPDIIVLMNVGTEFVDTHASFHSMPQVAYLYSTLFFAEVISAGVKTVRRSAFGAMAKATDPPLPPPWRLPLRGAMQPPARINPRRSGRRGTRLQAYARPWR